MFEKFFRWIFTLVGMLCGTCLFFLFTLIARLIPSFPALPANAKFAVGCACVIIFGIIFFIFAPKALKGSQRFIKDVEQKLGKMSLSDLGFGTGGLVIGLLIAFLISGLWRNVGIPFLSVVLSIVVYAAFGYLGLHLSIRKAPEIIAFIKSIPANKGSKTVSKVKGGGKVSPKVLDTSVIIDGRIDDIMNTGFIEGPIVIPEFVLDELRHIADSSDALKRKRGRRGLDVLNRIQEKHGVEIINTNSDKSLNAIKEVDAKLLQLAENLNGKVVTNDFNLNKVAGIKGVPVLNINELANTLKPVVLPGEEMVLTPVREGKENGQALAYLDDGTMVVVEDGVNLIGQSVTTVVTSVLQTSAGRMISGHSRVVVGEAARVRSCVRRRDHGDVR